MDLAGGTCIGSWESYKRSLFPAHARDLVCRKVGTVACHDNR